MEYPKGQKIVASAANNDGRATVTSTSDEELGRNIRELLFGGFVGGPDIYDEVICRKEKN